MLEWPTTAKMFPHDGEVEFLLQEYVAATEKAAWFGKSKRQATLVAAKGSRALLPPSMHLAVRMSPHQFLNDYFNIPLKSHQCLLKDSPSMAAVQLHSCVRSFRGLTCFATLFWASYSPCSLPQPPHVIQYCALFIGEPSLFIGSSILERGYHSLFVPQHSFPSPAALQPLAHLRLKKAALYPFKSSL